MSTVAIDSTGCIVIDGQKVFPIGLSEAPPLGGKTRDGRDAWAEVASAGANFVRSGFREWSLAQIDSQIATERGRMDAAAAHGMYCWPRLGNAGDLPPATGGQPSVPEQLSDLPNKDISVVGDVTKKMVDAAGGKPVWMTLQIAWSGVTPNQQRPGLVPRFPALQEERFMAYQAVVDGARGLVFFGGQLTQVMRPRDAQLGWNWTFWELVLRPLLVELTSPSILPALIEI